VPVSQLCLPSLRPLKLSLLWIYGHKMACKAYRYDFSQKRSAGMLSRRQRKCRYDATLVHTVPLRVLDTVDLLLKFKKKTYILTKTQIINFNTIKDNRQNRQQTHVYINRPTRHTRQISLSTSLALAANLSNSCSVTTHESRSNE